MSQHNSIPKSENPLTKDPSTWHKNLNFYLPRALSTFNHTQPTIQKDSNLKSPATSLTFSRSDMANPQPTLNSHSSHFAGSKTQRTTTFPHKLAHYTLKAKKKPARAPIDKKADLFPVFESKGIPEGIYQFLWMKDTQFGESCPINIPDTILMTRGEFYSWYFMQGKNIVSKKLENVKIEKICQKFSKGKKPNDVVCQYIRPTDNSNREYEFRYFLQSEFRQFLNEAHLNNWDGIIQQWIDPAGEYNNIIKVVWSEHIVLMESGVCKRKYCDDKFTIYERCSNFPCDNIHADSYPVRGDIVPSAIEQTTRQIIKHIISATQNTAVIKRATIFYKLSKDNKIWTLFFSDVKCKGSNWVPKGGLGLIKFGIPDIIDVSGNKHLSQRHSKHAQDVMKDYYCLCCFQKLTKHRMHEITYGELLKLEHNRVIYKNLFESLEKMNAKFPKKQAYLGEENSMENIMTFKYPEKMDQEEDKFMPRLHFATHDMNKQKIPQAVSINYPRLATVEQFNR
jgi:hypothetical protein